MGIEKCIFLVHFWIENSSFDTSFSYLLKVVCSLTHTEIWAPALCEEDVSSLVVPCRARSILLSSRLLIVLIISFVSLVFFFSFYKSQGRQMCSLRCLIFIVVIEKLVFILSVCRWSVSSLCLALFLSLVFVVLLPVRYRFPLTFSCLIYSVQPVPMDWCLFHQFRKCLIWYLFRYCLFSICYSSWDFTLDLLSTSHLCLHIY